MLILLLAFRAILLTGEKVMDPQVQIDRDSEEKNIRDLFHVSDYILEKIGYSSRWWGVIGHCMLLTKPCSFSIVHPILSTVHIT